MGCVSEHYTRWNRVSFEHLRLQRRLNNIVSRWPTRLQQYRKRVHHIKILVAKRKTKRAHDFKVLKMRRKVRAFKIGVIRLKKQSRALMGRYVANPSSVTPADWDRLFKGYPGKLRYIYHKAHIKESWPEGVAYLNMIALAVYQEKRWPRAHWPLSVPYLNFTALKEYQEKLWPRAKWPKDVPYFDFKARAEYYERRWPRAKWPKSVPYLDFAARDAFYEKHFPRAKWAEGVPYLDFVALAEYVKERDADSAKVRLISGSGALPSQSMSWHTSRLVFMHRQEPMYPLPEPQYDDRFHVELFKKRQQDAEYQIEVAKNNAAIKALKHFITQFDRVKLLVKQSQRDLRSATVKQWQDAAEGTDILDTNVEAAQHMEFSRRLEVGGIDVEVEGQNLAKMFEKMRREWYKA